MRRRQPPEVASPVPLSAPVEFPPKEPLPERLVRFDPADWPAGPDDRPVWKWIAWSNARLDWENRPGHSCAFGPWNEAHAYVMSVKP